MPGFFFLAVRRIFFFSRILNLHLTQVLKYTHQKYPKIFNTINNSLVQFSKISPEQKKKQFRILLRLAIDWQQETYSENHDDWMFVESCWFSIFFLKHFCEYLLTNWIIWCNKMIKIGKCFFPFFFSTEIVFKKWLNLWDWDWFKLIWSCKNIDFFKRKSDKIQSAYLLKISIIQLSREKKRQLLLGS